MRIYAKKVNRKLDTIIRKQYLCIQKIRSLKNINDCFKKFVVTEDLISRLSR